MFSNSFTFRLEEKRGDGKTDLMRHNIFDPKNIKYSVQNHRSGFENFGREKNKRNGLHLYLYSAYCTAFSDDTN